MVYDSYINYLQELDKRLAQGFSSYQGMATFISALILLTINRLGYKKVLLFCPSAAMISIVFILSFKSRLIYRLMTVLLLVSIQLYIAILPPFLTTYTDRDNRNRWYSRAFLIGYLGWSLSTYLGGFLTVLSFSRRSLISFDKAQELTRYLDRLDPASKLNYIGANKDILLLSALLAGLAIIPLLMIREEREDYFLEKHQGLASYLKGIKNGGIGRDALAFLIYISSVTFAMGLFSPYFTVFLNRSLHIDRSTSSLLVSISYLATVFFIVFTPRVVDRFGHITTLTGSVFISLPFMLIIANGDAFKGFTIPLVGLALFLRSGFANLSEPVESALPMETVSKEYRTLMSALVNIMGGIMSIVAGIFTSNYLFLNPQGYRYGYYIAALIYALSLSCLYLYFKKDYNFPRNLDKIKDQ